MSANRARRVPAPTVGRRRMRQLSLLAALCVVGAAHAEPPPAPRTALKVCADPHSLPSSNREQQGYENKIAELFGRKLGLPVTYEWFPQRLGFIRNTLTNNDTEDGSYRCDLVMSVTEQFDMAAPTRPYMRSAWAMVYVKGRGLDFIQSQDDLVNLTPAQRESLRIGIFDKGPATDWVAQNDLMDRATPFQSMTGDTQESPGKVIERDLIEDRVNLTFVWGPIAGYYAQQAKARGVEVAVIPLRNEPGMRFDFQIAMAVRHPDKAWKAEVNRLIADNQAEIDTILRSFGVPLLPLMVREDSGDDDDD
ncbi:MAG: quinoprotein dehydrogenase-associated putative ABC transporter substrate-binding protein [Gammaproteobacteria bacterium]|nr:quinoprotein dehydrogenase-associated putative ABC transporter substrate-binding protein [Gammaproteobacteria bacterium]